MYLFTALFGIALGGDYMIVPMMTAEIFGLKILGRLMGVIITTDGVAEAVSPWVGATCAMRRGTTPQDFLL